MARYLLDTDAIIDYLTGVQTSVSFIRNLHRQGDLLCVCDVVIAEVYAGLRPQDRGKAQPLLNAFYFLPTGPEAAQQAGEWRYAYTRQGVAISTTDVLIAATAQAQGATLVTGNIEDYPMNEVSVLPLPRVKQ